MSTAIARTILALGACGTIVFLLVGGDPSQPLWWLAVIPFASWLLLPYALTVRSVRRSQFQRSRSALFAVAAIALTASSGIILYSAFIADPDPQSGIVLVVLPVWQLLGLLTFTIAARMIESSED